MARHDTSQLLSTAAPPFVGGMPSLFAWLNQAFRTAATRRQLARLDDHALRDIGISRTDALAEAGRAPWDLRSRR